MVSSQLLHVLRQFSHEEFLSGERVAQTLGCSRATVNNAIRAAIAAGLPVHAVHGRGYRLARPVSWLDAGRLTPALAQRGISLRHFDELDSTNAHLMEWAQAGAPHRSVVSAEWQSRGRGRRGRDWHAGLGGGLMFSLLWRSRHAAAQLSGLSLAVGVMLVEALRELGVARAAVKWPNDIQLRGAKLAGVLIELAGDMLGPSDAVIGVGMNILGGDELTARVGQRVTDLHSHLGFVDRNEVLLRLIAALDSGLERFEREGFEAFREGWLACHAHQGCEVRLESAQGDAIVGIALGVDEQGALLLETGAGVRRFHSGEVSLRTTAP